LTRASTSGSFGRRERQLVDQHALQRVAGHVDAFPETLRADQHRARAREELLHQLALRPWPCSSTSMSSAARRSRAQLLADGLQRAQRRRQHEGAAAERARAAAASGATDGGCVGSFGFGKPRGTYSRACAA
jgi:hypothetical protein